MTEYTVIDKDKCERCDSHSHSHSPLTTYEDKRLCPFCYETNLTQRNNQYDPVSGIEAARVFNVLRRLIAEDIELIVVANKYEKYPAGGGPW